MSVRFKCVICEATLAVAGEQQAVDRVDCPRCRTTLLVPDPTAGGPFTADGLWQSEEAPVDFHARRKVAEADVDMTPMVDVTFLLLIFFMVTAAFSLQKSFQIPTPQRERAAATVATLQDFEDDPDYVVVRIDANSTFYISTSAWDDEREAPSKQDLLVGLSDARSGAEAVPSRLLVVAHGNALHERVVMAIDAGTAVGMSDVKLVTVEDDQS